MHTNVKKKLTYNLQESKFKTTTNKAYFFYVLKNLKKHEKLDSKITLKGIKPPQTLITKLKPYSQFTHKFQTAHDKLQKTNYLANKYVTADLLKIVSTTLVSKIKSAWSPPLCRYST